MGGHDQSSIDMTTHRTRKFLYRHKISEEILFKSRKWYGNPACTLFDYVCRYKDYPDICLQGYMYTKYDRPEDEIHLIPNMDITYG